MTNAERVILTGCSGNHDWHAFFTTQILYHTIAGGIGTYIHADSVKTMLPSTIKYHAMADAG